MLASTCDGDLFVWGCGLTHQLANRPRDVSNPADADEEPADELRPYRVSSKQLQKRFVMLADGGAQHSVELAWDGTYSTPSQDGAGTGQAAASSAQAAEGLNAGVASDALEPPAKRRAPRAHSLAFSLCKSGSTHSLVMHMPLLKAAQTDDALSPEIVSEVSRK